MGRAGREPLGDDARLSHQVLVADGAIDHAGGLGLFSPDRLGQHHERAGARIADEPGQVKSAACVGNEADARERLQELGRLRRQHDIAGECEIGPRSRRRSVDRADDRLRQRANRADDRIEALFERLAEIWAGRARRNYAVGEVSAGAEAPACAGDENCATVGVQATPLDRRRQRLGERGVQRVQALGPVQGERQHPGLELLQENRLRRNLGLCRHGRSPSIRLSPPRGPNVYTRRRSTEATMAEWDLRPDRRAA